MDKRLSFGIHVGQLISQARGTIGLIKHCAGNRFTLDTKKILYLAHVRHTYIRIYIPS